MNWKQVLGIMALSAGTAVGSVVLYSKATKPTSNTNFGNTTTLPANYANYTPMGGEGMAVDFTQAAQAAVPAVVHIKTKTNAKKISNTTQQRRDPFFDSPFGNLEDFFGDNGFGPRMQPEQRASGSGVLISADGNILTNNHVIEGADEVKVTLSDKKTYTAKVLGKDPASDLAVIKIEGVNLPYLVAGNSDDVRLGQWVLAIGYPLSLDCSVTAGIVSAKARSLGLNQQKVGKKQSAIESYIQHDAAVNPGNSGGALVNTKGELIGINAAIASPTGSYAGYSFTIPINIAKKIANDLIKTGSAQRAFLGVRPAMVRNADGSYESKEGNGVEISVAAPGGGAAAAGLKEGDIINKINDKTINTWNELVEQVASYSVGDKITLTYTRNGKQIIVPVTLKNEGGNFEMVTQQTLAKKLGAEFENVDAKKAKEYGIDGGVVVKTLDSKGMLKRQNPAIKQGFIILRIDGQDITSVDELNAMLENNKKSTVIQGFYPGIEGIYNFVLNNGGDDE